MRERKNKMAVVVKEEITERQREQKSRDERNKREDGRGGVRGSGGYEYRKGKGAVRMSTKKEESKTKR